MEMPVKRTTVIEGCTLFVIGVFGLVGGATLYIHRDARTQSSLMGPGTYVLILSVALILTAFIYVYLSLKKASPAPGVELRQSRPPWVSRIVIYVFGVFAVYAYLIQLFGYAVPTIFFLLAEFRLLGVKSWKRNIVLTAVVTTIFYIVFIKYCEMIFPHGTLLE
jgi:Tripartite tricarboxylate transporter TctB family